MWKFTQPVISNKFTVDCDNIVCFMYILNFFNIEFE